MGKVKFIYFFFSSSAPSDSWVDLTSSHSGPHSPVRVTPIPFGGEHDYLRMLQEAQRESTRSSTKVRMLYYYNPVSVANSEPVA